MRVNWKQVFATGGVASLLLLGGTGCGGFSGSKSVSPATFLIPGLMKNEAPVEPSETPWHMKQPVEVVASLQ